MIERAHISPSFCAPRTPIFPGRRAQFCLFSACQALARFTFFWSIDSTKSMKQLVASWASTSSLDHATSLSGRSSKLGPTTMSDMSPTHYCLLLSRPASPFLSSSQVRHCNRICSACPRSQHLGLRYLPILNR